MAEQKVGLDGIEREKIARLLRNDDAKTLIERLIARKQECIRGLSVSSELLVMGRYQGKLEIVEWLLGMRGE